MKKVLLTTALFFAAFTISAQESVVKEAKKAKSNPEEAAKIIEPALVDPSTANDPATWKLAGDFQKSIYDDENMKLYLPGGQNRLPEIPAAWPCFPFLFCPVPGRGDAAYHWGLT